MAILLRHGRKGIRMVKIMRVDFNSLTLTKNRFKYNLVGAPLVNEANPILANKTVTFSFGEDYDFLPSLLASARVAANIVAPKRHGDFPQNSKSSEWCPV